MADLVDMTLSEKERSPSSHEDSEPKKPKFPFGLTLHLDMETLKKLGMDDLPKVKTEMKVEAMAFVNDVHSSDGPGGSQKSMGLQITMLKLEPAVKRKSTEELLFGAK